MKNTFSEKEIYMNKKSARLKEGLWILKLASAVLALFITVRYTLPISAETDAFTEWTSGYTALSDMRKAEITQESTDTVPRETATTQIPSELNEKAPLYYETSEDIIEFEQEYLATFAATAPAGNVEEVFFKSAGSTHSVEGIYIKNATATKNPDFNALLQEGPVLDIPDKSEPVVLIFHTHTTESFLLSDNGVFYEEYETRSTDSSKNMVRIGEEICKVLEENNIGFIHDTTIYDDTYEGAYSRSRESVEKYLRDFPSIQIVLDVHRDAIYYSDTSRCKPTAEIDGKKAAQIMIITGAQEGYISDFPDWEDNLKFALCFQKTAQDIYPGLMKPLYFCQRKYNMDTAKCSLLLEVGADANTLDEAVYSGFLTGMVLSEIIDKYSGE